MTTPARYRALQWFLDHEVLGSTGVFFRTPPSARMRRLMARQGDVYRLPIGQFELYQWRLTEQGRQVLLAKPPTRPRGRRTKTDTAAPG